MRNRSILRCLVVGVVSAAAVFASAGVASATIDYRERGPLTDTDQHPNICGWPATFSDSGQYQLIVQQTTAGTLHVNWLITNEGVGRAGCEVWRRRLG
jgi:hypothetical protein